jgi:hypothetical protein
MCGPMAVALISGAASLAGAGASYMGQQAQVSAQNKSNQQWIDYQRAASQRNAQADEAARQQAEAARQKTLAQVTPQAANADINATANRLMAQTDAATSGGGTNDPNTALLSGQGGPNADTGVSKDIARIAAGGASAARPVVQAMATINGFTGGYGSATDTMGRAIQAGDQGIYQANDLRKGNDMTLGISQNVPATQYTQGQDVGAGISSALGNLAGNAFANTKMGGSFFKGMGGQ